MRKILQDKINMNDINKICIMTQGKENDHRKEELTNSPSMKTTAYRSMRFGL